MAEGTEKSGIFYGWFVVAACFFVTMSLGETMWSFGVFFKPLEREFGWSRSVVSSGYTAFLISYSLSSVIAGRLADRYGPRMVLVVCGFVAGLGIALCSRTHSVNEFRGFLFLAGLGAGATWAVPVSTVQRWFHGKPQAGKALAIVVAGVGVGALVFAPLINYLILTRGWRGGFLIVGILFSFLIVMSSLVLRRDPGDGRQSPVEGESLSFEVVPPDLPVRSILIHPSFLILVFATCVTVFGFQLISVHFVAYATDMGASSTVAAAAVGLMGAFSVPGRLLGGPIADRIGWKNTITFSLFGLTLTMIWLLFSRAEWMLYGFAFLFGLFWGTRTTSSVGTVGDFFGMRSLGVLIGLNSAVANTLGAFIPYIGGYIFDRVGSYSIVFIAVAVLTFGASLLATMLKKPVILPPNAPQPLQG